MQALSYRQNFESPEASVRECEWLGATATRPDNEFIVAYAHDGTVASRYGDMTWDFNAYSHANFDAKLSFTFWCDGVINDRHRSLIAEIKWLDFCNIWKRTDATLAVSTHKILHLAACRIASYAYDNMISIETLLCDAAAFDRMVPTIASAPARHVRQLIYSLALVDPEELGFVLVDITSRHLLNQTANSLAYEQTAPLPTRLYSTLLSCIASQLSETEHHIDRLLAISKEISSHPLIGRSLSTQRARWKTRTGARFNPNNQKPGFEDLTRKHGLVEYFHSYDVITVKQISSRLTAIQTLCKLAIHAYSGMRDSEAEMLPFGCLVTETHFGQVHHLICGKTYKFSSGLGRRAKWVAGEDAARGIRLAQRISKLSLEVSGLGRPDENVADDRYPLFTSVSHLNLGAKKKDESENIICRAVDLHLKNRQKWTESFGLIITPHDIQELENMDPFRDWKSRSYVPGNFWPLTTHQLRRSLALYASRSGLVGLPSLRRQLQHITQEMSLYYAKGSHFAKNFIGESEDSGQRHFAVEVQETAAESEMLSFLVNVIESDERLYGGQGAFWQRQKERRNINISKFDREKTLKDFRDGRRSYQVTPLGGCGKIGECTERAMGSFMGCMLAGRSAADEVRPCRYSYITISKLRDAIASQEKRMEKEAQLGTHTMYYKEVSDDLALLKAYHARISG
jgi:hypothetical protein